jgi:hypothetical protein
MILLVCVFLLHCELFCLSKTSHSLWASFSDGGHHDQRGFCWRELMPFRVEEGGSL